MALQDVPPHDRNKLVSCRSWLLELDLLRALNDVPLALVDGLVLLLLIDLPNTMQHNGLLDKRPPCKGTAEHAGNAAHADHVALVAL